MLTNEERREIAARLMREAQAWRETSPDNECDFSDAAAMMQDLCVFIGLERDALCSEVFKRLADLIEPEQERTCKVRQSYFDSDNELNEIMEGITFSPEDTVACICEACGHDWRYDRGIRPNYCPQCGAKVIDNE